MHGAQDFLEALALVLCVAGATTLLFQWLRQPVVLGYLIAGLIIGPHVPIPLVADPAIVHALSELGVILLMFSLGLELSLGKLARVGATAGVTAVVQSGLMMFLGFLLGRAFGWTTLESLFTGAMIAISSTTIIAKAFDEQGIGGGLRQLVVGILVVEDLIAIVLMATLTAVASGSGMTVGALALTVGKLAAFLVGLLVVGLLIVPRLVRATVRLGRPETTLVSSIGVCFAFALLAHEAGYSVALGAFIAGSLVAESGEEKQVEHLVEPVKDVFAAIFFVSVGMLLDPASVAEHWLAIVVLTVVVVVGKLIGVALGAFLTGNGIRTSVQSGMSLAQIGEFSFIIASLGLALGAIGSFLYPVAIAVSAVTTLTTPWLIRASGPVASWVDRALPGSLQTFAALYGSWLERARRSGGAVDGGSQVRRLARRLIVDVALLFAVIIGAALAASSIERELGERLALGREAAAWVIVGGAALLAAPFAVGAIRLAGRLAVVIGGLALPGPEHDGLDLAAAPRRALVVGVQLAVFLIVALPLLALTQPIVPGPAALIVLGALGVALAITLWRSAANLDGHARAGAQMIVEALASGAAGAERDRSLARVNDALRGLGDPVAVEIAAGSAAAGRTLAELDVRGLTGATVLAIVRGDRGIHPTADEVLRPGDVLAVAGARDAVVAARAILERRV